MILHTVNKSSASNEIFIQCLESLQEGDCIILLGDAINIARQENNYFSNLIAKLSVKVRFYALQEQEDNENNQKACCPELTIIGYDVFLDLAIQCRTSQSWY